MTEERDITVDGVVYRVVISDEQEALLAAKAAGRVFVGLLDGSGEQDLWGAEYLVESMDAADEAYLERVVRRSRNLPWVIGESERLCVREFTVDDVRQIPGEGINPDDEVFYTPEKLEAYIKNQYRFYEYGIWAVVRKSDGKIVGKAGVMDCDTGAWGLQETGLELGYHIFLPYRRQGYAQEACQIILDYIGREYSAVESACPGDGASESGPENSDAAYKSAVYAVVDAENTASTALLCKLGFRLTAEKDSGSAAGRCLYSRCLK